MMFRHVPNREQTNILFRSIPFHSIPPQYKQTREPFISFFPLVERMAEVSESIGLVWIGLA